MRVNGVEECRFALSRLQLSSRVSGGTCTNNIRQWRAPCNRMRPRSGESSRNISGRSSGVLPEFEQINNAACWDYQRDEVNVRSNERIRGLRTERHSRQQTVPINKVVTCLEQRPVECSRCHGEKIYGFGRLS